MAITLDGTNGISTPDLESAGQVTGTTGTFSGAVSGTTGTFSGAVQASGVATNLYPLVSGTAQASTSGTSIDFTGIPSWAKRVTVMFSGVSPSGASGILIQIGSGSVTTTGYSGAGAIAQINWDSSTASSSGFLIKTVPATDTIFGITTITLVTGNVWVASGVIASSAPHTFVTAGGVSLSGVLDRVRITSVNGTDTFDAGTINIMYE